MFGDILEKLIKAIEEHFKPKSINNKKSDTLSQDTLQPQHQKDKII